MPACLVCEHPLRDQIDEQLDARDTAASNGDTPSLEATCVRLQSEYSGQEGFTFTLPDILVHAKNCDRLTKPDLAIQSDSSGVIAEVTVGDDRIPVPSDEYAKAIIKAAGVLEIIKHPELVKPQHVIRVLEMEGGRGDMDELIKAVQNIVKDHPIDAEGPFKPPDA